MTKRTYSGRVVFPHTLCTMVLPLTVPTCMAKPLTRLFLVVVLLGGFAQSAHAQHNERAEVAPEDSLLTVTLPPELDRVLRDYEQGWRVQDADRLANLFTPDGFILRPRQPPVRGREAIAEAYRNSGGPLHLRALAYAQSDSLAYIIGGFRFSPEGPDLGKFILTLRRMFDGRWYITADMDNQSI